MNKKCEETQVVINTNCERKKVVLRTKYAEKPALIKHKLWWKKVCDNKFYFIKHIFFCNFFLQISQCLFETKIVTKHKMSQKIFKCDETQICFFFLQNPYFDISSCDKTLI